MAEIEKEENFNDILKRSKDIVGYIYPVVIDKKTYEIVDGKHRKEADPRWPEIQIEFDSRKDRLLYRIHANIIRRKVSRKERAAQLCELALYLEEEGVPNEEIAQEIVKLVPELSPGYIMNLLPAKYKSKKKREAGAKGAKIRKEKTGEAKAKIVAEATEIVTPPKPATHETETVEKPQPSVPVAPKVEKPFEAMAEKPKPKPAAIPNVLQCPRCHVEVKTLYCTKCFSELSVKEIAKILRRLLLG